MAPPSESKRSPPRTFVLSISSRSVTISASGVLEYRNTPFGLRQVRHPIDSDDVYSDEHTLRKIVEAFYEQRCAMVVGTYRMTDFDMRTIPPGIIDHKEWTPENGRNNALRINGLGAPRAFYTPLLRKLNLPNTSYGEDYALGLRISREYPIGRIYDVLYLCRRWEDNSDASLDVVKMNNHNIYKDKIRTWELEARLNMERQ